MGDGGAVALAAALRVNHTLRALMIGYNGIGHVGAAALARTVVGCRLMDGEHKHSGVRSKSNQRIKQQKQQRIEPAAVFGSLRELHMLNNPIGARGIAAVARALLDAAAHSSAPSLSAALAQVPCSETRLAKATKK
jgi:hypothetical protein